MDRRYKQQLLPGPAKTRIKFRDEKSLSRRSKRSDVFMLHRNITSPTAFSNGAPSKFQQKRKQIKSNYCQELKPDDKEIQEQRKLQLLKYKEEKIMKKKLEKELAKPVFKFPQHIKHDYPVTDFQQKVTKAPAVTGEKRVTRSMTADKKPQPFKETGTTKRKLGKSQRGSSAKTKNDTQASFVVPVRVPPQKPNVQKEIERRSFAPDNFTFNPPASWKMPVVEVTRLDTGVNEEFLAAFSIKDMKDFMRQKNACTLIASTEVKFLVPASTKSSRMDSANNNSLNSVLCKPFAETISSRDSPSAKLEDNSVISKEIKPLVPVFAESAEVVAVNDNSIHSEPSKLSRQQSKSAGSSLIATDSLNDQSVSTDQDCQAIQAHFSPNQSPSRTDFSKNDQISVNHEQTLATNICIDVTKLNEELNSSDKLLNEGTPSTVKKRRLRFAVGLECSPWITTSRGSSSRKKRQSLSKTAMLTQKDIPIFPNILDDEIEEQTTETDVPMQNDAQADVPLSTHHFESLVSKQKEEFHHKISVWNNIAEATPDIPEKALGKIHSGIGLARLLVNQRIAQFEGLILDCKFSRGEKETTCEDLLGFWEMILLQVEDINGKFEELEVLKARCWQEPESVKPVKRKKTVNKKPVVKKAASSSLRQFLNAARKTKTVEAESSTEAEGSSVASNDPECCKPAPVTPVTPRRRRSMVKHGDATLTPSSRQRRSLKTVKVENSSSAIDLIDEVFDENKGHRLSKPRRKSVRFLVHEDDTGTETSKYRTTPFLCHRESKLLLDDVTAGSVCNPLELSFKEDMGTNEKTNKREPSLLPMPEVEIVADVTSDEDLMRFSPLTSIENTLSQTVSKSSKASGTPLRRSIRQSRLQP